MLERTNVVRLSLPEIESRVCDIAAEQVGMSRANVQPWHRPIEDLHIDSLDLVELMMEIEDEFEVALPDDPPNATYKTVFTRPDFRLSDFAELVYLQQDCGRAVIKRKWLGSQRVPARIVEPFTQLGGTLRRPPGAPRDRHEPLGKNVAGRPTFRRRMDGMVCVELPAAEAVIGSDEEEEGATPDERPAHRVALSRFIIDAEPVSTTAYCRFLNSIGPIDAGTLQRWFRLTPDDHRHEHELLRQERDGSWAPLAGTERMPAVLISWYGANAYSLWANGRDWRRYDGRGDDDCFLPSEVQWEYAARGPGRQRFPWGDAPATPERMSFGRHQPGTAYRADALPMADVHENLGLSPFGLRHMAGNVWQWCRDWYDPSFFASAEARERDAVNRTPLRVRSERGGSWIGPSFLCRSSYRRGRMPSAKGRCLGFRCVGRAER